MSREAFRRLVVPSWAVTCPTRGLPQLSRSRMAQIQSQGSHHVVARLSYSLQSSVRSRTPSTMSRLCRRSAVQTSASRCKGQAHASSTYRRRHLCRGSTSDSMLTRTSALAQCPRGRSRPETPMSRIQSRKLLRSRSFDPMHRCVMRASKG